MAGFLSDTASKVKDDFEAIWKDYGQERLENHAKQKDLIRSAHKIAICFSFLSKATSSSDLHKRLFLQELASDAIHLVHTLMVGDARGGSFYLRSIIENFWRHLYYRDHPIEFGWLHTRTKYKLTMAILREHCGWLDCFKGKLNVSLGNLERLYADLSTDVHSTSARTVVLREDLRQIVLSTSQSKSLAPRLRDTLKDTLVLLIFAERDVFDALHINTQSFILECLDAGRRRRRQGDL